MSLKFQRKVEDFKCEHCDQEVKGNGYTNHCPHCLWSKHRDVNPGDRAAECDGMMKPIDVYLLGQDWTVVHQCEICNEIRKNHIRPEDDREALIKLQQAVSDRKMKG